MEEEIKGKNDKLNDYIRNSKIVTFRNSMAMSRQSKIIQGSSISPVDFPESKMITSIVRKSSFPNRMSIKPSELNEEETQPLRVSVQIAGNM